MKILGIDPGIGITGFGLIETSSRSNARALDFGVITTEMNAPLPGRLKELYESLDDLQTAFDDFAKVEPPKEFKDCKMLSEKASTYIANSSTCFHFALDEEYNQEMFNAGVSNFNEAIKCINYMGDVLQKKQSNK